MPKTKTHKATSKRFKISKNKKFMARAAGQDHFNSRDTGKNTVRKRRDKSSAKVNRSALKKMMPYYQH